jgi:hypothetical protein
LTKEYVALSGDLSEPTLVILQAEVCPLVCKVLRQGAHEFHNPVSWSTGEVVSSLRAVLDHLKEQLRILRMQHLLRYLETAATRFSKKHLRIPSVAVMDDHSAVWLRKTSSGTGSDAEMRKDRYSKKL